MSCLSSTRELFCLIKFKSFLKTVVLSSLIMLFWLSRKIYLFCTELSSDNRVLEALCKYASSLNPAASALSAWVSKTAVKSFHVGPRSSCNEKQISNSYSFFLVPPHNRVLTDQLTESELLEFRGILTFKYLGIAFYWK